MKKNFYEKCAKNGNLDLYFKIRTKSIGELGCLNKQIVEDEHLDAILYQAKLLPSEFDETEFFIQTSD